MPLITHVLEVFTNELNYCEIRNYIKNTASDKGGGIFARYTSDSLMPLRQYAVGRGSHAFLA